ncbi:MULTISPECIES: DUF202 domain-containing protein [Cyanophyceae]|uniref:YidH family protein n=1 Tax=Cyanophyceae TaxID=3028117 RepID=UPI0016854D33|nr:MULTISPECIES: DUF202 domain-containing protein [Cyanophyceae]MBD1915725.1 DUF202 domain-containing protein [Phormidium sp. FACHB-77]MBD2029026.1 DUF202 domain-containing protein [Phormidium sp. FACHB-322]MBD2052217.1 DUF202 domain-containing protein [Leptolyngbya sp. FACHB-60]
MTQPSQAVDTPTTGDRPQSTSAPAPSPAPPSKSSSRARDHMANERTYLAWMRTAIALIGFGVLIARLRYLVSPDVPGTGQGWMVGLGLCSIGLITVLLSTWHYFAVLDAIESNTYEPNSRWVILFSLVVTLLGAGVLYVLFSAPATVKGFTV